jgi:hypothetical protein
MLDMSTQDRDRQAMEYLQIVRSLTSELERAMLAISCNALSDLEESIAEQEVLTSQLQVLYKELWVSRDVRLAIMHPALDRGLANEALLAHRELQELSRVYEAVLRSSSHSGSLMASLLGSYKGHFQEASGPRLKYQTWSCQM